MIFIPDTTEFLDEEEQAILQQHQTEIYTMASDKTHLFSKGGYSPAFIHSFLKKGFLSSYNIGLNTYFYDPTQIECRPVSFTFQVYRINLLQSDGTIRTPTTVEANNIARMRKFVANWIYGKEKIENCTYERFLILYVKQFPFTISCPFFLVQQLKNQLKEIGIVPTEITPKITPCKCQYCSEFFFSARHDFDTCPKCGEKVLVRS